MTEGTTYKKEGRDAARRDCGTAAGMSVAWFPVPVTGLSPAPSARASFLHGMSPSSQSMIMTDVPFTVKQMLDNSLTCQAVLHLYYPFLLGNLESSVILTNNMR